MTAFNGLNNNSDQSININWFRDSNLRPGETGNSIVMFAGNDTVMGSQCSDMIAGGYGNDMLDGYLGNDFLSGEDGNDTLIGGYGNDSLYGGAGNDSLNGGYGVDFLCGGTGNDTYVHNLNSDIDIINDNQTLTGAVGAGGGSDDVIKFTNVSFKNLVFLINGSSNLYITSADDFSDNGVVDDGVIIQNYFLGGNYKIELIAGSDGIIHSFTL